MNYAYGSSAGILLTYTPITIFSSNPSTSILYDPCLSVNRGNATNLGIALSRILFIHEEVL